MKQTFKIICTTMAACLLFLTACQKDDEKQATQQTNASGIQVSTITFDQFKANSKALQELQKAAGNTTKDIIDDGKSFFYDDSRVTEIVYGDITTYTFTIYRYDMETDLLENLVIREKSNGETESFILEYTLTQQEIQDIADGKQIRELDRKARFKMDYDDPYYGGVYHRANGTCYIYTWYDEDGIYGVERQKDVKCPEGYDDYSIVADGSQGTGNPGNGGGNNGGGGGIVRPVNVSILYPPRPDGYIQPGSGTPPVGSGGPRPVYTPIITQPIINVFHIMFENSLTPQQKLWYKGQFLIKQYIIGILWGDLDTAHLRIAMARKLLDFMMANGNNIPAAKKIMEYLKKNESSPESIEFAEEMLEAIKNGNMNANDISEINKIVDLQDNSPEGIAALKMLIKTATNGYFDKPFDQNYYTLIDPYTDANLAGPEYQVWVMHFTIQCATLRLQHPTWSDFDIYWEATKDMIHIALDLVGLVPVVGEVADLTNGIIYAVEGDGLNATLSIASMIPVAGIGATTIKYAKKTINITSSTKTTLKWLKNSQNIYTFGNRSQLRKVLNLATGDPRQAHHIIPWGKSDNLVVQRAAGSGNAFHMNQALNGIPLNNAVHSGPHTSYDNKITEKLVSFLQQNPNPTPQQCYNKLTQIIQQVRTAIINNPNVHLNNLDF